MKIKTIGTGALNTEYRSFCTLIDNKILIDCGNGILKTMIKQNIDLSKIDYLLITHMHGDHFFDIPFLIIQRDIIKSSNQLKIFCPKGGKSMIYKLTKLAFIDLYSKKEDYYDLLKRANVVVKEIESGTNYTLDDFYEFDSLPVKHGGLKNCYSYIIHTRDKNVGISGDSSYCDSIDEMMNKIDIAIFDMSFEKGSEWHMGLDDINNLMLNYNTCIIANHLSDSVRTTMKYKNIKNLIIPEDGDEYNF